MDCPVQCGRNAHAAPGFFLWQELPLKHPERMRSSMPQAAFYGDWGVSPTSRKSLSCHESPACRRKKIRKIRLKSFQMNGLYLYDYHGRWYNIFCLIATKLYLIGRGGQAYENFIQ